MEKLLYNLESFLRRHITRGGFLRICLGAILVFIAENKFLKFAFAKSKKFPPRQKKDIKVDHDLISVSGKDPYQNTVKAIAALGGMSRFVNKGDVVVVKPNMAWDRNPAQAANTDPQVVAALVELCYKAGAKRVNVFDVPCNDAQRVYVNSGIEKAAKEKGAKVFFADHWNVVKAQFPYKSPMENWPIIRDAVVCDTFINVPVLKDHSLAGLTLSMKNLMGVCSGTRGLIHMDIGRKLVDLTDYIKPELTVIDATRVLTKNGPSGGNLEDVINFDTVIASQDATLADYYAAQLVKRDPQTIPNIKEAVNRGYGITDPAKADILTVAL